jgi:hypothetical protein
MEELLFGGGIALLISLLAWSDQIRGLHKETLEAEQILLQNREINYREIKRLIRRNEPPQVILDKLSEVIKKDSKENIIDLELILKYRSLDKKLQILESLSNIKYYFIIGLTACFLISGIISSLINACRSFFIQNITIHLSSIPFISCMFLCGLLLAFLVYLNKIEKSYRTEFDRVLEEM